MGGWGSEGQRRSFGYHGNEAEERKRRYQGGDGQDLWLEMGEGRGVGIVGGGCRGSGTDEGRRW